MKKTDRFFLVRLLACLLVFSCLWRPFMSQASEVICTQVKIEIQQEATFARQAFDAHMRINNGLTTIALQDIKIDVLFTDEAGASVRGSSDPNDLDAFFFVRLDTMDNINDVNGNGSVAPATSADIHWLIIPSLRSVEGAPQGALYYVGARLSYTIGGEENVTEVTPDYIHVNPLPDLTLDYFLTEEVYGDDPFTQEIERVEPFTLGVRVQNNGYGPASNFKIDSAQPKIVENKQGLLIEFSIVGSEINGVTDENSLLIRFGDIEPNSSTIARWLMKCTLSGRFVEFDAEFSHADELGGQLTSVLSAVNTHWLIGDVQVDLPGRDTIRDFLARDGDVYRVYESENSTTDVIDRSSVAQLTAKGSLGSTSVYTLTMPPTAGFIYVKLTDPMAGQKMLVSAVRSDGKVIKKTNAWLSRKRVDTTWSYYLNLFDANTTESYILTFVNAEDVPQAPLLQAIPDRRFQEEDQVSFLVESSDPNGTTPSLSAAALPVGATFVDNGDGTGIFDWTSKIGQAGIYPISFSATDGEFTTVERSTITVKPEGNSLPATDFTASRTSGPSPLEVTFTDVTVSLDGIESWTWNFGDGGAPSHLPSPTHTYYQEGVYSVSLTVVDEDGDSQIMTKEQYIKVAPEVGLPTIEYNTIDLDHNWQPVEFTKHFTNPVIVASLGSDHDNEPAVIRIRNLTETGCEMKLQEGGYADDQHLLEQVTYLVVEEGSYAITQDIRLVAGNFEAMGGTDLSTVTFEDAFPEAPVVVAQITTFNDETAVTYRLSNTTPASFDLRLQEEEAEVQDHGPETISYVAWQVSTGIVDGLLFEVARTEDMITHAWQPLLFSEKFPATPSVVAALQSEDGPDAATLYIRNIQVEGVEAKVAEETSSDPEVSHTTEVVGFIAITPFDPAADSDGDGLTNDQERFTYGSHPGLVDSDGDGLTDAEEIQFWGDSWGQDVDQDGLSNLLDRDADNDGYTDGLEAQHGYDPADPLSKPDYPIMEFGTTSVDHDWRSIILQTEYLNPVIVATAVSQDDPEPAVLQIQKLSANSFMLRLREGAYLDGIHGLETVSYMVMEAGTYTMPDGTIVLAAHAPVSATAFADIDFAQTFSENPVITAAVITDGAGVPVAHRLRRITATGFEAMIQSEEAQSGGDQQTLSYIAWQPSSGNMGTYLFEVSRSADVMDHTWQSLEFSEQFPVQPTVIADIQTSDGLDPVTLAGRLIGVTGLEVRLVEEASADSETTHTTEVVGFVALTPFYPDLDSDNDGLANGEERTLYKTHPGLADSDGDGVDDGAELTYWGDAWNQDADHDGLHNLLDPDSDNDGYLDGLEIQHGFDPQDAAHKPMAPIMEYGSLTVNNDWQTLSFATSYLKPVIIATITSSFESEPALVRIRNVSAGSAELRLQEGSYQDGVHGFEQVSYIVMEAARYTLADGAVIEAGQTESAVGSQFSTVRFQASLPGVPVVLANIISENDETAVSHALRNITAASFDFILKEEEAEAQDHASETVAYIAWPVSQGRINGFMYEAGKSADEVTHAWYRQNFKQNFPTAPLVLATIQTMDGGDPATVHCQQATFASFQMRVVEETSADAETSHTTEVVGFLALTPFVPTADSDGDGLTDGDEVDIYGTHPALVDSDWDDISDAQELAYWGDAWSQDADNDGLINILDPDSDNDGYFDGLEIHHGFNPGSPASKPEEPIMEFGSLEVGSDWTSLQFAASYLHPVLVATINNSSDSEPVLVRIANVNTGSADLRLQEAGNQDDVHVVEQVTYVIVEAGRYTLADGRVIEAGLLTVPPSAAYSRVAFLGQLPETPVLLTNIMSSNDITAVTHGLRNITAESFDVILKEEEAEAQDHAAEILAYIAWPPSMGHGGGLMYEASRTGDAVTHLWYQHDFSQQFPELPLLIATSQTTDGADPVTVHCGPTTIHNCTLRLVEETSADSETSHTTEVVGYLALSPFDPNADTDGDGLTNGHEADIYGTHPALVDTDNDGLVDGVEVTYWGEAWSSDLDNDGLINLLDFDSDNDGFPDGLEVLHGFDPGDPLSRPLGPIMEMGMIRVGSAWQTVTLDATYLRPVLIASPVSAKDDDPQVVRIRNVQGSSFEIQLQQDSFRSRPGNGWLHHQESIHYLVMESATYTMTDGAQVVANAVWFPGDGNQYQATFPQPFIGAPGLAATVSTTYDPNPVWVDIDDLHNEGFSYLLHGDGDGDDRHQNKVDKHHDRQDEADEMAPHGGEMLDYVAWYLPSKRYGRIVFNAGKGDTLVTHIWELMKPYRHTISHRYKDFKKWRQ
jgi:PKD repeat protein